jgi:UDP-glucose 4-epimerase
MTVILITGGLGYIGSHIAVELLNSNDNYTVIIIDNLENAKLDMVDTIKQNKINKNNNEILFYKIDMKNIDDIEKVFQKNKIDIVIHMAGYKSVNESIMEPILYYNNNLVTTLNLIYVMKQYNCKNIIFSSSATVYGNASVPYYEVSTVGVGLTNPYGKTKYMQEEMLRDLYFSDNSWSIVILRYFNPISQKNKSLREKTNGIPNNLFPYLVKVHNKEMDVLNIYGNKYNTVDGTCVRDFIHVLDLADSHIQLCNYIVMNKPDNIGLKTYNVGTGNGISVKQLIDAFEKENNTKLNYQFVGKREGDLEISYADVSLIYKEIGWKTKYGIKDMVKL